MVGRHFVWFGRYASLGHRTQSDCTLSEERSPNSHVIFLDVVGIRLVFILIFGGGRQPLSREVWGAGARRTRLGVWGAAAPSGEGEIQYRKNNIFIYIYMLFDRAVHLSLSLEVFRVRPSCVRHCLELSRLGSSCTWDIRRHGGSSAAASCLRCKRLVEVFSHRSW